MAATQRIAAGAVVAAAVAASLAGCATGTDGSHGSKPGVPGPQQAKPAPAPKSAVRLIGDGSTAYTGAQPHLPRPERLKPGEKPPQFVVFSWDGAGEDSQRLFSHFRKVSKANHATMTYFLSGVYMLPEEKADLYKPPQHSPGRSDIGFNDEQGIADTVKQLRLAWLEGNEIGTHFNGHFCGAKGGKDWSVAEWKSEIDQFYKFVENWKTNTGYKDIPPLPFDFRKEVTGGRAPCLEGQPNLLKAAKGYGWRYDASNPGGFQIWPTKKNGLWDFPLQALPNGDVQSLSMDFNFLANQSDGQPDGDPAKYTQWEQETLDSYMAGFNRVYYGSRAPLFIGNHFEQWNGGIYMKAVDQVIENVCTKKDVKCVSFRELADWMDVQSPATLERMRTLDPAQNPDWSTVVK